MEWGGCLFTVYAPDTSSTRLTASCTNFIFQEEEEHQSKVHLHLDAANLGDFPATYLIPALKPHEFPAVGVYVDPRIVPGFRYRVRPIDDEVKLTNINAMTAGLCNRSHNHPALLCLLVTFGMTCLPLFSELWCPHHDQSCIKKLTAHYIQGIPTAIVFLFAAEVYEEWDTQRCSSEFCLLLRCNSTSMGK